MLSNHSASDAVRDLDLVADHPRQPHIHLARHAVLDGDDVRQLGDPRAQLRAHQIAGVLVAPHRDADVDLLADGLVVLVERLVAARQEVQHRRVHDDIGRADRLGMLGELDHHIHVLVGAGGDHAGLGADLVDHDLHRALALGNRHREELALLAGDENAVDAELVDPMPQVPAEPLLVDRKVLGIGHQGGGPDALEVGAGVVLGFRTEIFHGKSDLACPNGLRGRRIMPQNGAVAYLIRCLTKTVARTSHLRKALGIVFIWSGDSAGVR